MNYSTIHELPVLSPSFTVALLGEEETSSGFFKTGQINLYAAIGNALEESLQTGFIQQIKAQKIITAYGDSDVWSQVSTFFIQNSSILVTKDYLENNYLSLAGGNIQTGLMEFGSIRANFIITENNIGSEQWNETSTYVKEYSALRVYEYNNNVLFTNLHHGKAHHFNTPLSGSLTVTIPLSVMDGFNITLMNTGLGTLILDSPYLLSTGTEIETRYSGAFVYKDNGIIYAVGNLT